MKELIEALINQGIITAIDIQRMTTVELLLTIIERVNELHGLTKEGLEAVQRLLDKGVQEEVIAKLEEWTQDGTFDTLINQSALKTVNDRIDETNEQLSDIATVNIKNFSHLVVGGDWTNAIQSAINTMKDHDVLLIPSGKYNVTSLTYKSNDSKIICDGELVGIGEGTTFKIGETGQSIFRVRGNLNVSRQSQDFSIPSRGVVIVNANECQLMINASNHTTNIELIGYDGGCSYNNITLGRVLNGKNNLLLTKVGTGWVNENKFYGGRFMMFDGVSKIGCTHINISDESMNNNVFFSPSLENNVETYIYCVGRYNTFYSPRLEGEPTWFVNYNSSNAIANEIIYPYMVENLTTTTRINNLGRFNKFLGRYSTDNNQGALLNTALSAIVNTANNPDVDDTPVVIRNLHSGSQKALKVLKKTNPNEEVIQLLDTGEIVSYLLNVKGQSNTGSVISTKDKDGNEKFNVNGNGKVKTLNMVEIQNMSGNSLNAFEVKSTDGLTRIQMKGNGDIETTGIITAKNIANTYVIKDDTMTLGLDEQESNNYKVGDIVIIDNVAKMYFGELGWKTFIFQD